MDHRGAADDTPDATETICQRVTRHSALSSLALPRSESEERDRFACARNCAISITLVMASGPGIQSRTPSSNGGAQGAERVRPREVQQTPFPAQTNSTR